MHEQDFDDLDAEPTSGGPARRYAVPITRNIRIAALALFGSAIVLLASGTLTWFETMNPGFKSQDFGGFRASRANAWFKSVPIGWVLLVVVAMLCAVALKILRSRRARWLLIAGVGCTLVSAATVLLVLKERSYVPLSIPRSLRESVIALIKLHPESKAKFEKQFSGLAVEVRLGLWVALVAAVACTGISGFIVMKSRRPREVAST